MPLGLCGIRLEVDGNLSSSLPVGVTTVIVVMNALHEMESVHDSLNSFHVYKCVIPCMLCGGTLYLELVLTPLRLESEGCSCS
jgi:hypothetical protein